MRISFLRLLGLRSAAHWKRRALFAEKTVRELAEQNTTLRNGILDMEIIAMDLRAELWVAQQPASPVYELEEAA